jgi:glycosyltransferase involved in cell wall biosynthesis
MSDARALRVLHVTESMGTGVLQVIRSIVAHHAERGIETTIAYGERPETPADLRDAFPSSVRLVALPWRRRTAAEQLRAGRALRGVVHAAAPDVVHLHSTFAAVVGSATVRGRIPTVLSPHALASTMTSTRPLARPVVRAVERTVARRCSVVGAVSSTEADDARRLLGAPRVVVVENGIPELDPGRARVREGADPAGRPTVVAAGRIVPQRRPDAVAEILAGVRDLADVAWIGAAPEGSGHDAPLREREIPVTGWLDRDATMAALAGADAYLHFTAWDGQAISLLEALAEDLAIVASDIPASRAVLPPRSLAADPAAAIALLRRLLADPGELARHRAAQREGRARFSARRMADDWARVYVDLARRGAAA